MNGMGRIKNNLKRAMWSAFLWVWIGKVCADSFVRTNIVHSLSFSNQTKVVMDACEIRGVVLHFYNTPCVIQNCLIEESRLVIENDRGGLLSETLAEVNHNSWRAGSNDLLRIYFSSPAQVVAFNNNYLSGGNDWFDLEGEGILQGRNNALSESYATEFRRVDLRKTLRLPETFPFTPRIEEGSPLIDRGVFLEEGPEFDRDGDYRGLRPDIGADEW